MTTTYNLVTDCPACGNTHVVPMLEPEADHVYAYRLGVLMAAVAGDDVACARVLAALNAIAAGPCTEDYRPLRRAEAWVLDQLRALEGRGAP